MRTGVPCNENRLFLVGIDLQGVPCKPYRVWVCSVLQLSLSGLITLFYEDPRSVEIQMQLMDYTGKKILRDSEIFVICVGDVQPKLS